MQVKQSQALSRQQLINQMYHLDLEAKDACISFLIEQYPALDIGQSEKLIDLIFENNFKAHLPNHFGRSCARPNFGYPFIWLLNELEVGGIQYLYQNRIWQIHWDAGDRRKTIKFLVTAGPSCKELWEEHGLIFWAYRPPAPVPSKWQYPFPEDIDLSCNTDYLLNLKLATS